MVAGQRPFPHHEPVHPPRAAAHQVPGGQALGPADPALDLDLDPRKAERPREQQEREPELEVAHERAAATRSGTVTKLYPFGPR